MAKNKKSSFNISVSSNPQPIKLRGGFSSFTNSSTKSNKLNEIRKRTEDAKRYEKEENDYNEYIQRYSSALATTLEDIETLIGYFLNRTDISIDKDYEYYNIRKEITSKNLTTVINFRITVNSVSMACEGNNFYEHIEIINETIYSKYASLLEEKYFEYVNRKSKIIMDEIENITKLNRKTKISKLIADETENT